MLPVASTNRLARGWGLIRPPHPAARTGHPRLRTEITSIFSDLVVIAPVSELARPADVIVYVRRPITRIDSK